MLPAKGIGIDSDGLNSTFSPWGWGVVPFPRAYNPLILEQKSVLLARKKVGGEGGNGCGVGNQQCSSHHPHLF